MAMNEKHLSSLPKLNKDQFIASYIKAQRAFSKQYLMEGKAVLSLWQESKVVEAMADPPSVSIQLRTEDYGFGTPVLRARVQDVARPPRLLESTDDATNQRPQRKRKNSLNKSTSDTQKIQKLNGRKEKAVVSRKKAHDAEPMDLESNEQAARLKERRQRKKAKREILKPSRQVVEEAKISPGSPQKAVPKTKVKHLPGFALMHGFSATNVGKNRLTMGNPLGRPGVFGKGKASTKARVDPRKRKKKGAGFSESEFLNGVDRLLAKSKHRRGSPSVVGSDPSSDESMADCDSPKGVSRKTSKINKAKNKKRLPSSSNSLCSNGSSEVSHSTELRGQVKSNHFGASAESFIWDIEKDPSLELKSNATSSRPKTVVLDTTGNRHCRKPGTLCKPLSVADETELDEGKTHTSSPSLGPSQSASQLGRAFHPGILAKPGGPLHHSKFFRTSIPQPVQRPASESEDLKGGTTPLDSHALGVIAPSNLGENISGSHGLHEKEFVLDKEWPSSLRISTPFRKSPEDVSYNFDDCNDGGGNDTGVDSLMEGYGFFVDSSRVFEPTNLDWNYDYTFDNSEPGYSDFGCAAGLHGTDWIYEREYEEPDKLLGSDTERVALFEDEVFKENIVAWPQLDYDDGRYFQAQVLEIPSYDADGFTDFSDQAYGQDVINICSTETTSFDTNSLVVEGGDGEQADQFFEGRALLLGYDTVSLRIREPQQDVGMTKAEAEVAKVLKYHWLPQKL